MAFTEAEQLVIARVVGYTPTLLAAHLATLTVTSDVEAAVREELDRWATVGTQFVKIHPRESNKGVETNSADTQGNIRRNIAVLLEIPMAWASMGTLQIG